MTEVWKPYPLNPKYQVSNLGRVQGPRVGLLKQARLKGGHCAVGVYTGNHNNHLVLVHRMVLEVFIGPCPDGMEACHGDGNPANNSLDNLRWDTRRANKQDAIRHGVQAKGERINTAKLTEEQVREIRKRFAEGGVSKAELSRRYSVTQGTIYYIICLKTWKHIK